jgi:putative oxidoreductase
MPDTPERPPVSTPAWGLLPLRLVVAAVFLMHGGMKLFVMGMAGVTGMFTHMGIPLAAIAAPLVTAVEILGGLAVLTGVFTRWAGLLLAADMAGAILFAKLHGGFFSPQGYELELLLLGASLTLAAAGPGGVSLGRKT